MSDHGVPARPRWMAVYEHLRELDYKDAATYEKLSAIAGVDDIRASRNPVARACLELERNDRKTLVCVPNYGYRIADPSEHEHLGRQHRLRAHNQLRKEYARRASTAFELLPAVEAERLRLELDHSRRAIQVSQRDLDRPHLPKAKEPPAGLATPCPGEAGRGTARHGEATGTAQ